VSLTTDHGLTTPLIASCVKLSESQGLTEMSTKLRSSHQGCWSHESIYTNPALDRKV